MNYREVTLKVTVRSEDADVLVQGLNNEMDRLEKYVTVFASQIEEKETGEPENAAEIGSL